MTTPAEFMLRSGLQSAEESATWTALTGGVSSDLWRVDLPGRSLCVKRALPTLRVGEKWQAPVTRNAVEYAWLTFAARHRRGNVPRLLAHDPEAGYFAMEFLPHPVWKTELMAGRVDPAVAAAVGNVLGELHRMSTRESGLATEFANDANFAALRLEPYFTTAARRHPQVARQLVALADRTAATHLALVHGDISPKNILVGRAGPVFLDAECAVFGDPAFDLAFCLTHLALKMLVRPDRADDLRAAADSLLAAHASQIDWESVAAFDHRVTTLVPALLLARVDGASPVEYLTDVSRTAVRKVAIGMLLAPVSSTHRLFDRWRADIKVSHRC
ncbi:phosphotransferase [Nocardia sp. CA-120079]|uniref:phosphotransferase n=1 Tax=Nocardia sp. CA-120079 TaxID=3239974 RepID=UPI003D97DFE8